MNQEIISETNKIIDMKEEEIETNYYYLYILIIKKFTLPFFISLIKSKFIKLF